MKRLVERVSQASAPDAGVVIHELQNVGNEIHHCRFAILTQLYDASEIEEMLNWAKKILEEVKSVVGLCHTELSHPRDEI